MKAMNAIIKYPGSKWRIADWIIGHFPEHHTYLEPFFGSGAVLFRKERSNIETVNDLDGNVVNLFEWIRKDPERLAREIYYTPYARQIYENAFTSIPEDRFQQAVYFFIKLNMGHGFRTTGEKVGWKIDLCGRERAYAARNWGDYPEQIFRVAERLRGVQIENMSAVDLIRRYNSPKVLVYADPPYVIGSRYGMQYRCEMDNEGHEELLDVLLAHKGPVLISGYESNLYRKKLKDWYQDETISCTQTGARKKECLWMNFRPDNIQMSLNIEWL